MAEGYVDELKQQYPDHTAQQIVQLAVQKHDYYTEPKENSIALTVENTNTIVITYYDTDLTALGKKEITVP